jgi:V8-like Glu-specific endopeptidase
MPEQDGSLSAENTILPAVSGASSLASIKFNSTAKRPVADTDQYRLTVAKIHCFAPGDPHPRGAATGVFIAKDVLLTVGHALFNPEIFGPDRQGYADHVKISSPWFPISLASVETARIVATPGWVDNKLRDLDLGIVKLDGQVPGAAPLAPRAASNPQLRDLNVRFYGFPVISSQLFCGDGVCLRAEPGRILHNADAGPGESGSPLLAAISGPAGFVGLHRAGPGESPPDLPQAASALRLTGPMLNWVSEMLPLM